MLQGPPPLWGPPGPRGLAWDPPWGPLQGPSRGPPEARAQGAAKGAAAAGWVASLALVIEERIKERKKYLWQQLGPAFRSSGEGLGVCTPGRSSRTDEASEATNFPENAVVFRVKIKKTNPF